MITAVGQQPAADDQIGVLSCNARTVEVFQHCQPTYIGGGMGIACVGIAAAEAYRAARMLRVPRRAWREVLGCVQLMGRVAAEAINAGARS